MTSNAEPSLKAVSREASRRGQAVEAEKLMEKQPDSHRFPAHTSEGLCSSSGSVASVIQAVKGMLIEI